MLDLGEIKRRMRDRKITVVAQAIGLHKVTLYRVLSGEQEPGYATLKALSDYLTQPMGVADKDGDK